MSEQTIIIVDDDPEIREALSSLIRSVGLQSKALASVPEFLDGGRPEAPTCLVLDVRLPGRSGLDFQRELAAANIHVPGALSHCNQAGTAVAKPDYTRVSPPSFELPIELLLKCNGTAGDGLLAE
jgi:DNA-binding NtrC family response regulator